MFCCYFSSFVFYTNSEQRVPAGLCKNRCSFHICLSLKMSIHPCVCCLCTSHKLEQTQESSSGWFYPHACSGGITTPPPPEMQMLPATSCIKAQWLTEVEIFLVICSLEVIFHEIWKKHQTWFSSILPTMLLHEPTTCPTDALMSRSVIFPQSLPTE